MNERMYLCSECGSTKFVVTWSKEGLTFFCVECGEGHWINRPYSKKEK